MGKLTGKFKVKTKVVRKRPYSPTAPSSFFSELDERFLRNEGKIVARSENF
jgi:hypothetical protein